MEGEKVKASTHFAKAREALREAFPQTVAFRYQVHPDGHWWNLQAAAGWYERGGRVRVWCGDKPLSNAKNFRDLAFIAVAKHCPDDPIKDSCGQLVKP
jgi:hypothetical protein